MYVIYIYTWGNSSNVENPFKSLARSPSLTPLGVPGEAWMPHRMAWVGEVDAWWLTQKIKARNWWRLVEFM